MAKTNKEEVGQIRISNLHASAGDKEKIYEDTPEGRAQVAEEITRLIKEKATCFLEVGKEHFKITGYDQETNEWILVGPTKRAPSRNTDVLVVSPMAGG
ncbi:hypothetical protein IPM19_03140 [bacterium]|nr:MAG: hypothetical protein IPM19_03140 [bacterium]